MRVGIISDVHANPVALEAVLKDMDSDLVVSLGDNIGYLCNPNEVLDMIWEISDEVLEGRQERQVRSFLEGELDTVSPMVEWTAKELEEKNRSRLYGLRESVDRRGIRFSHNGLPDQWSIRGWEGDLSGLDAKVTVCGHMHYPQIYRSIQGQVVKERICTQQVYDLSISDRSLIFVPSVGMPLDFNACAGYAVLDTRTDILRIKRVEYDVSKMIGMMQGNTSYPYSKELGDVLRVGTKNGFQ